MNVEKRRFVSKPNIRIYLHLSAVLILLLLTACTPSPEANVVGYLIADQLGTVGDAPPAGPTGSLMGQVLHNGEPVAFATVIVAERWGTPHVATTDADGRYIIEGVPPGQYVPAAVAPGFDEEALTDALGLPYLVDVRANEVTNAPPLRLEPHVPAPLPPLADLALAQTDSFTTTAAFPPDSIAEVQAFRFERAGVSVDTLRLYLPLDADERAPLPLVFVAYPGFVDDWSPVSTAVAAQGYAVAAWSPLGVRAVDIDAHAQDARVALDLARRGELDPRVDGSRVAVMGGSFTSAVLHRLLRDESGHVDAWITLGGISDAFAGAAAFYRGEIILPERFRLIIPALGAADLQPVEFLRYSPVYSAGQLPPTLLIHTASDRVIPIEQAYALAQALEAAGVPVDTFYYEDVTHYLLQIGEDLTEADGEMLSIVVGFIEDNLE